MTAPADPQAAPNFEALRVRLSTLRNEKRMTYDELSARTGIARSTLVALETGSRRQQRPEMPHTRGSLESWWRIARALGLPLADLLSALDVSPTDSAPERP